MIIRALEQTQDKLWIIFITLKNYTQTGAFRKIFHIKHLVSIFDIYSYSAKPSLDKRETQPKTINSVGLLSTAETIVRCQPIAKLSSSSSPFSLTSPFSLSHTRAHFCSSILHFCSSILHFISTVHISDFVFAIVQQKLFWDSLGSHLSPM